MVKECLKFESPRPQLSEKVLGVVLVLEALQLLEVGLTKRLVHLLVRQSVVQV